MKFSAALILALAIYGGVPANALSGDERQAALDAHNSRRSSLALGNEPAHGGGKMPKGKNIYKLTYSDELEGYAQSWADGCVFEHSPQSSRPNAGENIYYTTAHVDASQVLEDAANWFWKENVEIGVRKDLNFTQATADSHVGHFTAMAWGRTTELGCGVGYCEDAEWTTYVVCNYRESGNWINSLIYEKGNPCQEDSDCTTFEDSTCSADEGLCQLGGGDSGEYYYYYYYYYY